MYHALANPVRRGFLREVPVRLQTDSHKISQRRTGWQRSWVLLAVLRSRFECKLGLQQHICILMYCGAASSGSSGLCTRVFKHMSIRYRSVANTGRRAAFKTFRSASARETCVVQTQSTSDASQGWDAWAGRTHTHAHTHLTHSTHIYTRKKHSAFGTQMQTACCLPPLHPPSFESVSEPQE